MLAKFFLICLQYRESVTMTNETETYVPPHLTIKRLARDWHAMGAMMNIYCRTYHGSRRESEGRRKRELCVECNSLLDYTGERLDQCPYGAGKPTCGRCHGHCFEPARLEQTRRVMCYAGAFMWWKHPIMSLQHWWDGWHDSRRRAVDAKG